MREHGLLYHRGSFKLRLRQDQLSALLIVEHDIHHDNREQHSAVMGGVLGEDRGEDIPAAGDTDEGKSRELRQRCCLGPDHRNKGKDDDKCHIRERKPVQSLRVNSPGRQKHTA